MYHFALGAVLAGINEDMRQLCKSHDYHIDMLKFVAKKPIHVYQTFEIECNF